MRYFATLISGAIGAAIILVALIFLFSAFNDGPVEGMSCHDPEAISLYDSYKECAEFQRSIGNDPNTGLPR